MRELIVAAALVLAGCAPPGARISADLALRNVTVIDVARGVSLPDQTLLISGRFVSAIGHTSEIGVPPGTRTVDGTGMYLIPGLWDAHTHVTSFGSSAIPLLLAHGVTGVRDMGADSFARAKALRDSIQAGLRRGPRMRIASPVVENRRWLAFAKRMSEQAGTPWTLHERSGPSSAAAAERWVDSVAALGADHIKVRNWPSAEVGQALVSRARLRGLPVVGHANEPFPRNGVATYEHGIWPPLQGSDAARDSLWTQIAASGAGFVPTLVTWPIRLQRPDTLLARLEHGSIPGLRYVPTAARERWTNSLRGMMQESPIDWEDANRASLRDVTETYRKGIPILAGTDLGAPLLVPGLSLHDEMALLVENAGLTPLEALQAATLTPVKLLGLADSLGGAAPGKLADFVLLGADPLTDIRNTRKIRAVIVNGQLLDRTELDRLLAEAEAAAK